MTGAAPWPGLRLTPANGEWGASSPARSSTALPLPTVPPAAPDRRQLVLPVATTIFAGRDGQASRPPANSCAGHRLCRYTVRVNSIDTHVGSPKGHYVNPLLKGYHNRPPGHPRSQAIQSRQPNRRDITHKSLKSPQTVPSTPGIHPNISARQFQRRNRCPAQSTATRRPPTNRPARARPGKGTP